MVRLTRAYKKRKKRKSRKQRGGSCGCVTKAMTGGRRKTKRTKRIKRRRRKKTKRRKRRKGRRKQRGGKLLMKSSGFGCDNPGNLGAHFGNKLNMHSTTVDQRGLGFPYSNNNNTNMKGGGVWSDMKNYWWQGNDALTNSLHTYRGGKPEVSSKTMFQPGLSKDKIYMYKNPDLGKFHEDAATSVADIMVKKN